MSSLKREEMVPVNGRPRGLVDSQWLTEIPGDLLQDCAQTPEEHDITRPAASPGLDIDRGTHAPFGSWSADRVAPTGTDTRRIRPS